MNPVVLGSSTILLYLVSAGLIGLRLLHQQSAGLDNKFLLLIPASIAAALHAWLLADTIAIDGGLNLEFFNALSAAGWIIVVILLVMALRAPIEILGIGLMPIAALAVFFSIAFNETAAVVHLSAAAETHIIVSMLAYSLLSFAAMLAVLLAIQIRQLHQHRPGGFVRILPPLNVMEAMLFQVIGVGFLMLTLSLLSGFLYLDNMFAQHLVHKTILSITAWSVFGTLLAGRHFYGWRGKIAVRWTLSGIVLLVLAYFGSKLVLELILAR